MTVATVANQLDMSLAIAFGQVNVEKLFNIREKSTLVETRGGRIERESDMKSGVRKSKEFHEKMRKIIMADKYGNRPVRDVVIELHRGGMTYTAIAKELWMHTSNVSYHLQHAGETKKRSYAGGVRNAVSQYTMDGEHIADYCSITHASKQLKIPRTNISSCCLGVTQSTRGFRFAYQGEKPWIGG